MAQWNGKLQLVAVPLRHHPACSRSTAPSWRQHEDAPPQHEDADDTSKTAGEKGKKLLPRQHLASVADAAS
jgi:hypothetical protein